MGTGDRNRHVTAPSPHPNTTSPGFLPEPEVLEQASAVLSDLTDIDADGVAAVLQRR